MDHEKANEVIETYASAERDAMGKATEETKARFAALEPINGLGFSYLNITKAALRMMFLRQKRLGVNTHDEAEVFGEHVKWCLKQAKTRKHIQGKKNYVEKMDSTSAPLAAVKYVKDIEEHLFNKGVLHKNNPRVLFSSLRVRMLFLFSSKGILRGDCLYQAQLSDLFHIEVAREDDAHLLMVLLLQFANCKTNDGLKLFGCVGRHVDPSSCPIGSIAFYLLHRFYETREMDHDIDWFKNDSWFDIKFITEYRTKDKKVTIKNASYGTAIKGACKALGIPSAHFVHIGRVLGSCEAKINEDSSEDLRFLGNWDPKVQEQRYSTKVPMKIIRSRAGLSKANGLNYNPRSALSVPTALKYQVFPWLKEAQESFIADKMQSSDRFTAKCFFNLMDELQTVAIQDAAAMALQNPERFRHGLFLLPVFLSQDFRDYMY